MDNDGDLSSFPQEVLAMILLETSSKDWKSIVGTCKRFRELLHSSYFRNRWKPKRIVYTTSFCKILSPKMCEISSFITVPDRYGPMYGPMLCWPCKVTGLTKLRDSESSINLYILKGRYMGSTETCSFACRQYAVIEDE